MFVIIISRLIQILLINTDTTIHAITNHNQLHCRSDKFRFFRGPLDVAFQPSRARSITLTLLMSSWCSNKAIARPCRVEVCLLCSSSWNPFLWHRSTQSSTKTVWVLRRMRTFGKLHAYLSKRCNVNIIISTVLYKPIIITTYFQDCLIVDHTTKCITFPSCLLSWLGFAW